MNNSKPQNFFSNKKVSKNSCLSCGTSFGNFRPTSNKMLIAEYNQIVGWMCGLGEGCGIDEINDSDDEEYV